MKICKIDYNNPDPKIILEAAKIIRKGGIVIVPTETVYAILGSGLNEETVKKIVTLKKRDENKRFDLTLYPVEEIFKYVEKNSLSDKIIENFTGKPVSLSFPRKKTLPHFLNKGYEMNAFHFFFSKIDEELFKHIDVPLIGTSANISSFPDTGSLNKVTDYFRHTFGSSFEPDMILNAGELSNRKPSSIIEITKNKIQVVREGDLSADILKEELKKIKLEANLKDLEIV